MTWFDNLLNHFALYPAHLFVLLFVMALSKSTVLISSVLPPMREMRSTLARSAAGIVWLEVAPQASQW